MPCGRATSMWSMCMAMAGLIYRGGPMHYANSLGLDNVLAKLRHYQALTGDDFWEPSPLLVSLADKGPELLALAKKNTSWVCLK